MTVQDRRFLLTLLNTPLKLCTAYKTCIPNVGVASSLDPLFCDFFKSDDLNLVCSAVKHLRNEVMLVPAGCELMFYVMNLLQCTVRMLLL